MNIIYEPKTLEWTKIPNICNTNNHKIEEHQHLTGMATEISSEEYQKRLELTDKSVWIKYFPDPIETIKIPLSHNFCKILHEASIIGYLTKERPRNIEELQDVEDYVKTYLPDYPIKHWFVRINRASPKDGKYNAGPLLSAKDIVTSLSTSLRIHKALNDAKEEMLYVVPWHDEWNEDLEFRVFIHNKKVTCFSQYAWCRFVNWNPDTIRIVAPRILEFCNNIVIPVFPLDSYVVDVIVVSETNDITKFTEDTVFDIKVIEFNSFGIELASGAALFHWINDYNVMYGKLGDSVTVRYVSE